MKLKPFVTAIAMMLASLSAGVAYAGSSVTASDNSGIVSARSRQQIAKIVPGESTKKDVEAIFGTPWRIVQFNDCGMAMDDQADEIWEYRGAGTSGGYRVHIEFGDNGVVHLIANVPDETPGGGAIAAKIAPNERRQGMPM